MSRHLLLCKIFGLCCISLCTGCYFPRMQFESNDASMILRWNPRYTVVSSALSFDTNGEAVNAIQASGLPGGRSFIYVQYPHELADALPEGSATRFTLSVIAALESGEEEVVLEKPYEPILLRPSYSDDTGIWDYLVIMPPDNWSDSEIGSVIDLDRLYSKDSNQSGDANAWRATNTSHTINEGLEIVFDPHRVYKFRVSLGDAKDLSNLEQYDIYLVITSGARK